MKLPDEFQSALKHSLHAIRDEHNHELSPIMRRELINIAFQINPDCADKFWRWLAVICATRVAHLYEKPTYPERYYQQVSQFSPDEWKTIQQKMSYIDPQLALEVSKKVLLGSFDRKKANQIAGEVSYYVGYWRDYQTVKSVFAEFAGNRAFVEVTLDATKPFQYFDKLIEKCNGDVSNLDFALSIHSDAAAHAFISECCVIDYQNGANENVVSEYERWVQKPSFDLNASLEYWVWWLEIGVPEAWQLANQG